MFFDEEGIAATYPTSAWRLDNSRFARFRGEQETSDDWCTVHPANADFCEAVYRSRFANYPAYSGPFCTAHLHVMVRHRQSMFCVIDVRCCTV